MFSAGDLEGGQSSRAGAAQRSWPAFILGRIVFSESNLASKEHNPYNLEIGAEYHIITAEIFHDSCGPPIPDRQGRIREGMSRRHSSSQPTDLFASVSSTGASLASRESESAPTRERGSTVEEIV
jgi:hypothetical protein